MKVLKSLSILALAITIASCGKQHLSDQKLELTNSAIVGGHKVETQNFQSVIGLADEDGKIFCTGNLISPTQILTASHCIMSTQVSMEEAMSFLADIQDRVNATIQDRVRENVYAKEDIPTVIQDIAIMKSYIKMAIKSHMEAEAAKIAFHIGTGSVGRSAVETRKGLVAKVDIPSGYVDSLFITFFGRSPYAEKSDVPENTINPDQALITLSSPITDVTPVPFMSEEEARTLLKKGESKISLVGFGQKADTRASIGTKGLIAFLKANLNKAGLTEQQINQLNKNIELLTQELDRVSGLIETSGDKNTADITVADFDEFIIASNSKEAVAEVATVEHDVEENSDSSDKPTVEVTEEELEALLKENILDYATKNDMTTEKAKDFVGACFGDSGGPAFARNENGDLIQIGVIVAVDFCGKESYISPIRF